MVWWRKFMEHISWGLSKFCIAAAIIIRHNAMIISSSSVSTILTLVLHIKIILEGQKTTDKRSIIRFVLVCVQYCIMIQKSQRLISWDKSYCVYRALKCQTKIAAKDILLFLLISCEENKAWFFMWILCCLAEDSLETSSLIFSEKQWKKKNLWMSSAAVMIGTLRVKTTYEST